MSSAVETSLIVIRAEERQIEKPGLVDIVDCVTARLRLAALEMAR